MSQNSTPKPDESGSDRKANLLNLLKFNQASSRQNSQSAIPAVGQNGDTTASAFRSPSVTASAQSPRTASNGAMDNPQDMLLNLLKRPDHSGNLTEKSSTHEDRSVRDTTPLKIFGAADGRSSPFQPSTQTPKGGRTSYVNPFEQLHTASPTLRSPPANNESFKLSYNSMSPAPPNLPDGRSQLEALMGIGATREDTKPVNDTIGGVANKANTDFTDALETVEREEVVDELSKKDPGSLRDAVYEAALEVQDELEDGVTKRDLERTIPKPLTEALQETVEAITGSKSKDGHGLEFSKDTIEGELDEHFVRVYNLPMRPFVCLDVKDGTLKPALLRNDIIVKIATLKKDFDQIDRTLASASPNHIVYATAKNGGFRIVRQDDGSNHTVFRGHENQIFNVTISSTLTSNQSFETVLATGNNGSVYWISVPLTDAMLEEMNLNQEGFIMPPLPSTDENTSTSQLKTRAKKSSRHPEFFAVGRGKSIYLVWPSIAGSETYTNPTTRVVDTQRYLSHCCLKIATGKAGKDFTFSEDDTVVVSLDKHGRIKFWDITEHIERAKTSQPGHSLQVEAKVPIMTLWLTSSNNKAWPTSVQFVDKDRPTVKGIASRYLLVGLKQNHTIQLWDLGLGKAVQEINLPHANETDAICSIGYHAKSGIIAVGHPTRNSLYLIHLSAPKYSIPSLTQTDYLRGVTQKSPRIPRPDSTAIMSGLREISISALGDLRSVDISPPSAQNTEKDGQEEETIFEVYVAHSRGVTCLNLKRTDFGWGKDGKVVHGLDAEAEGIITVTELQSNPPPECAQSEEMKSVESSTKPAFKQSQKGDDAVKESSALNEKVGETLAVSAKTNIPTASKHEKKKTEKKKPELVEENSVPPSKPPSYADALSRAPTAAITADKALQPNNVSANGTTVSTAPPAETIVPRLPSELSSSDAFSSVLSRHMEDLYKRMDKQRRVQEAANTARQDAVLRLVSATLTENVEKSLDRIVSTNIREKVIPAISEITSSSIDAKFPGAISSQISESVPRAIQGAIPNAIAKSLQAPGVLQTISEQVGAKLSPDIKKQFNATLQNSIIPAFQQSAVDAARTATTEIEHRVLEQLRSAETKIQHDAVKIEQLTRLNSEMSSTVADMAAVQGQLLKEVATLRGEMRQYHEQVQATNTTSEVRSAGKSSTDPPIQQEEKDEELEVISEAMKSGRVEEGTIRWLQSPNQNHIFDELFISLPPTSFLPHLNPIVNLSVSAAISGSLSLGHLAEKLTYLETVLDNVEPADPQIKEFAPRMMDVLNERVSDEYMRIAEERPGDPLLSRMSTLVRRVRSFRSAHGAQ